MMDDELVRMLAERAARPAPIYDTVERTAFDPESLPRQGQQHASSSESVDPYLISLLGGLADTGSTYTFLKRGTASEDNALVGGLSKHPTTMAALGAAANIALPLVLKHTLGKKFPKIARALAANQGALQMGYGAINTQNTLTPGAVGRNTAKMYRAQLLSNTQRTR